MRRVHRDRLAEPTFTLAEIRLANESNPGKAGNLRERLAALADFTRVCGLESSVALDHPKVAAYLHELPARGLSPEEVKRLRKGVKAALRASRRVPILAPHKMTLSPAWQDVARRLIAPPPQMRRFMAWAHLRAIEPDEVSDCIVADFHRDYHAISDPNYVQNQVGEIVHAWNRTAEAHPELALQALTPRVTDRRRRLAAITPTMLEDIHQFLTWRRSPTSDNCDDLYGNPFQIEESSAAQMETELRSAVDACQFGIAVNDEPPRLLSLRDLVANYENLVGGLLLRADNCPAAYERAIGTLVRAVAADYVKVPPQRLAEIDEAYRGLGKASRTSSPARHEAFVTADDRAVIDAIVKAPAQIRFEAEAAIREDVRCRDRTTALALDLLINAPLTPAEIATARYAATVLLPTASEPRAAFRTKDDRGVEQLFWLEPVCTAALVNHRDWLRGRLGHEPTFLFIVPGTGGADEVITAATLSRLLTTRLEAITGIRLTAMQLRYLHGLMLMFDNPAAVRRVQHTYGHQNVSYTKSVFREILDKDTSELLAMEARR